MGRLIQGEPFRMRDLGDGEHGKSLVIPLSRRRAIRIGFKFRSWCKLGPRRYTVVATQQFVEQFERLVGGTANDLRSSGVKIEGDLSAVPE